MFLFTHPPTTCITKCGTFLYLHLVGSAYGGPPRGPAGHLAGSSLFGRELASPPLVLAPTSCVSAQDPGQIPPLGGLERSWTQASYPRLGVWTGPCTRTQASHPPRVGGDWTGPCTRCLHSEMPGPGQLPPSCGDWNGPATSFARRRATLPSNPFVGTGTVVVRPFGARGDARPAQRPPLWGLARRSPSPLAGLPSTGARPAGASCFRVYAPGSTPLWSHLKLFNPVETLQAFQLIEQLLQ